MKRYRNRLGLLSLVLLGLCGVSPDPPEDPGVSMPFAVICPISDMVDDGMAVLVERAVREAKGAQLMVFQIDTPGGRVDSAIEITKDIVSAPCKTVAFIEGQGAISAGALIAYSCDDIIMTPATSIGASAPVMATGGDPSVTMDLKAKSFLRARYRAMAEEKKHNPLLAEAMVDPNIELRGKKAPDGTYEIYEYDPEHRASNNESGVAETVRKVVEDPTAKALEKIVREIAGVPAPAAAPEGEPEKQSAAEEPEPVRLDDGSELICPRGELLTLTSGEALRYGLIPTTAPNLDAVLNYEFQGEIRKHVIVPTWSEALYRWLTSPMIAGLLLLIGIGGIYIEFKTPGVWLPGVIGVAALAIFFGAHLVIGLADWFDVFLVLLGVLLLAIEIFVVPGFGLLGVGGISCLLIGLYLSLTRVTVPEYSWDFDRLQDAAQTLSVASILFVVFVAASWKFLPKTPLWGWLVLQHAQQPSAGYVVQTEAQVESAIGLRGVSLSMLRPAGRARFGGTTFDVMTRGEFVGPGRPVEIIEAEGNRYVVAEIHEEGPASKQERTSA